MTDVAQDPQLNMAAVEEAQTTEQNRFETIRNAIPVQLRPTAVPHPLTYLSTERNEIIDRLYPRVENRPPSDRLADAYFIDEVKTVTKSGGFELEFVPEGNIRLSNDRKYGFVVGPNGFLKNDASSESKRYQKRLLFILSTSRGGRRCCGYYSYVDVDLEPLSPHELQYPRLAEQLRNQHGGGPMECTAIVFHSFADEVKAIIQDVTCPDPRQQGAPDQFSVPTRPGSPAEQAVQATSATSARSSPSSGGATIVHTQSASSPPRSEEARPSALTPVVDGLPILRGRRAALMNVEPMVLALYGIEVFPLPSGRLVDQSPRPAINETTPVRASSTTAGAHERDFGLTELLRATRLLMSTVDPQVLSSIGVLITAPQTRGNISTAIHR